MDKFSFLNAVSPEHIDQLYQKYLQYPDAIEPSWRAFFQGFDFGRESSDNGAVVDESNIDKAVFCEDFTKEFKVIQLIDGYRTRGHLFTRTNPVRTRRTYRPTLDLQNFGLSESDLDIEFQAGSIIGIGNAPLRKIIEQLEKIYCESIGIEYMYIRQPEVIQWIQQWINKNNNHPNFSKEQKLHILKKLNQAVSFENFLHTKYVGQKRFSLEGNETLIPALDTLIESAAEKGVEQFVLGMAHRGRLNVLTNIFDKPVTNIFSEFDGKDYEQDIFDGDVKYHLGWTSTRKTDKNHDIILNIVPNPSHLETVGAVVQGIVKAKQDKYYTSETAQKVMPIVIHGDAAISGQGIAYEVVQMALLEANKTEGTIHIVVNNQVGFTTNYLDGRSSTYCTDVGKATLSPVLHVNADDAEAVAHALQFAVDYRMHFKKDVFIDLLGYRKYGHNEGDEPRFTQPKLYKAIAKHDNARDIYAEKLIAQNIIDKDYVSNLEEAYKTTLEEELKNSRSNENTVITPFMQDEWEGFEPATEIEMDQEIKTAYPKSKLDKIAKAITSLPKDKKFIRKTERLIEARHKMYFEDDQLDWAMGELLAYGSLLLDQYDVRISGQDVERGTFSHRHAVLKVEDSEEEIVLHDHIDENQGQFRIFNSLLSEYAVVGFDYGYALANPNTLTIWEAQFGDFSNGAQIMIDQYISSGEDKWKTQNGLVMLLPHGYEGQGAEHSSARIERYLQLCATDNMFVANCTTPANLFHLFRRHMLFNFRKPLIVFTPKSLLRHPKAVSKKADFTNGKFMPLIDDTIDKKSVNKVVFTSGKFYYDLLKHREENEIKDVSLVRLEQYFPLPVNVIESTIKSYAKANQIIWAQEEPRNMGAWSFLLLHYPKAADWKVCSRNMYAAPASGSATRSAKRHQSVIEDVFKN